MRNFVLKGAIKSNCFATPKGQILGQDRVFWCIFRWSRCWRLVCGRLY